MLHPSAYIQDEIQKIEVYKKIAAIESMDDYKDIKEELEDRYSVIPEAVTHQVEATPGLFLESRKIFDGFITLSGRFSQTYLS